MMTNKQTIDGVSRDRIEDAARVAKNAGYYGLAEELRALLDSPCTSEDLRVLRELKADADSLGETLDDESLAELAALEAAQPQGEVERLRAELANSFTAADHERLVAKGQKSNVAHIARLSARLAERDALLRESYSELLAIKVEIGFRGATIALIGRIDAILSTSAEPKPLGETVYQWSDDDGISWCDGNERSLQSASESGWKTRTLYTEQPAPSHLGDANEMVAKVVLPERKIVSMLVTKAARQADLLSGSNYYTAAEFAAEAVISEVAKLNGVKP